MSRLVKDLNIAYIALAVLFQALSGVFAKYASLSIGSFSLTAAIFNPFYVLALTCLVLQALVWQNALKRYDLMFAYPFIGLVSFIVLGLSYFLFNESVQINNVFGLFIVLIGIFLLTREVKKQ